MPDSYDRERLRQIGRIGAYRQHARHDVRATTQGARDAKWQRYLDKVDPDHELPEDERVRRAEAERRADMIALAHKSARARRKPASHPADPPDDAA